MKSLQVAAFACLMLTSIASAADAPKPPVRPPGVDEARWVAINENFGFVISKDARFPTITDPVTGEKKKMPSTRESTVSGYFSVRREGVWCRINIEPSDALIHPALAR